MNDELPIFRNELKNRIVSKYKVIGISSELILSFQIFKKNDDLETFIEDIFEIKFRPYVFRSRTTLVSRVVRTINNADEIKLSNYKNRLYKFIQDFITKQ